VELSRENYEREVAHSSLERYSGSPVHLFQDLILLTNFPHYVVHFTEHYGAQFFEGSMFTVAHCPNKGVSILDFKIGSPAAALTIDLLSHLPGKLFLFLGMCGGVRDHYSLGEYCVPVASIRGEGTSNFYLPEEVPALANFVMQRAVTHVLEEDEVRYHLGITYTTNKRFWEFDRPFVEQLKASRAQVIEMEAATLFIASYRNKMPLGALLLISDLPLQKKGVKTKESSEEIFRLYMSKHVEHGIRILHHRRKMVYEG